MGRFSEVIGAGTVPEPARLMALRLHALHAEDREWILAQLPADARNSLEELLAELRRLGFPALPELLSSADPGPFNNQDKDSYSVVNGASCEQVWEVLRDEPEAIRNCILSAHDWLWQAAFAQRQYATSGTTRIDPNQNVAPRARDALIRAFADRTRAGGTDCAIQARNASGSRPSSTSLRQRIAAGLRRPIAWLR